MGLGVKMEKVIEVAKIGLEGIVASWEVVNPDGSIAQACYTPSKNLILDVGLDMIGNNTSIPFCFGFFAIGTGTSDPAVGQTTLDTETTYSPVARPAASGYSAYDTITIPAAAADPFIVVYQKGIQTDVGKINGTFTELGFGPTSTKGANLFSRFRVLDEEGFPTSVAVSSVQQLRLKYQLCIRFLPIVPTWYETAITGYDDTFGYTAGWQSISAQTFGVCYINLLGLFGTQSAIMLSYYYYGSWRYPATTITASVFSYSPLTTNVSRKTMGTGPATTATRDAYVPGSYANYVNVLWTTLESIGNIYGLQVSVTTQGNQDYDIWLCKFDTPINKPDTHNLSFKLKFSWGRDT